MAQAQYFEALEGFEREEDMKQVAQGLTMDLASFQRQAWEIVEPDTPLVWSWHYEYLCEWLTLVVDGRFKQMYPDKLGLIINVPPRSGKSIFASVNTPAWAWAKFPSRRFLCGSHSLQLASAHNAKRNHLIGSQWYQERFGDRFKLTGVGALQTTNDRTGQFLTASIGSKHTGRGGLILIGDDLLDREDQFSAAIKKRTNNWLDSSFSKMLDDQVRGVTVHISQRLAIDDPTGHLIGEDKSTGKPDQWIRIKIRREATEEERYEFPISGEVHVRRKGDVLQAERCPPAVLIRLKAKAREWANQEQQEPTPETGALLNPNHLRWYRASAPLPSFHQVYLSVDCNFKEGAATDDVAIHKYALVERRRYLLDRRTENIGYIATKQAIKEMARGGQTAPWLSVPMPPATQIIIEDKANGPAIIEELRADPSFPFGIIAYNPGTNSKTARFIAATGDAEAGLIYFPEDAHWVGQLRKVLCDYAGEGSVPHDDDCDAFSQFVNWSRQMQYGLLGYYEKLAAEEARQSVHRCIYTDENGVEIFLEYDEVKEQWFDPKNPERTYAPAPADSAAEAIEAGEPAVDGAAATEAADPGTAEVADRSEVNRGTSESAASGGAAE